MFIFVSEIEFDVDPDDERDELGAVFDPPAKVLSCANPTEGPGEKRKIEYTFFYFFFEKGMSGFFPLRNQYKNENLH